MYFMSTLVVPLAIGVVSVGLVLLIVIVLAGLVYELTTRGNRRQVEVDEEREQVTEQIGLSEHIDFQSDLRPPREP
jgi:CHASE1-domain containing sensor protein